VEVFELGEFGLIDRLKRHLGPAGPDVIVGIGDDTAVLRDTGDAYLLATCDTQIEGVHFVPESITPYQLGRRAAAVNISDIAAMGGAPTFLLISLCLPSRTPVDYVDALYSGLQEETQRAGAAIVGGNMARLSERVLIDVFLLGRTVKDRLLLRSGAKEGDLILVTGYLGNARAGLELVRRPEVVVEPAVRREVMDALLTPRPRLVEGQTLAATGRVSAAIDVSDGALSDLGHVCRASKVGARIWTDSIPVSESTRTVAALTGHDPLHFALQGGEDYELLVTVPEKHASQVMDAVIGATGLPLTVMGRIGPARDGVQVVGPWGKEDVVLPSGGWNHFAP